MNFPTATAADWTAALARLERFARAHDLTADDAAELAQACACDLLTRGYSDREGGRCPATLAVAVGWRIATARRWGVWELCPRNYSRRRRSKLTGRRVGLEDPQAEATPAAVRPDRDTSNPATMAAAGEELAARMPKYAAKARAAGLTPAALALVAAGWGPMDEDDSAKASPSVPQCGPGYTPPAVGCRGLHSTDPNPASREASRRAAENDARRVAGLPPV